MTNAINWFEIPATDFTRAKKFYETLLGAEIMEMPHPVMKYGMLPADMQNGGVGGGLVQGEGFEPSSKGTIVYLNGGDDFKCFTCKSRKCRRKNLNAQNFNWTKWIYGSFFRHRGKQSCTSLNEITVSPLQVILT